MRFDKKEDVRSNDDIRREPQNYIQSQYSASPILTTLLKNFRNDILPYKDIRTFWQNVMNIETASGVGLDNWGRIVGMNRVVTLQDGTRVTLADDDYRKILLYKALANISDATGATLNKMMSVLFAEAAPLIVSAIEEQNKDGQYWNSNPMRLRWFIDTALSEYELALFKLGGTLCVGAGVGWDLVCINTASTFGFSGSGLQPFNQGVFWDGSYIDRS